MLAVRIEKKGPWKVSNKTCALNSLSANHTCFGKCLKLLLCDFVGEPQLITGFGSGTCRRSRCAESESMCCVRSVILCPRDVTHRTDAVASARSTTFIMGCGGLITTVFLIESMRLSTLYTSCVLSTLLPFYMN